MHRIATTRELLELLDDNPAVQFVEVLPASDYQNEHLPRALNIPLRRLDRRSVGALDPARSVVAYCFDYQ